MLAAEREILAATHGSSRGTAAPTCSFFVGLGPPDGDAARQALEEAVRAAP